ncbi:MAG: N-6 DNA methylase [Gammaproteobacteria bacterium]|nr:N-6 DNA methylase [Gammaproteobacteria bacterium]
MGRHSKAVLNGAGIDRRDTGYYSTPAPVAQFFRRKLLSLNPAPKLVFDPCAGRGELLAPFRDCGARLCGFDIMDLQPGGFFEFERCDFLLAALAALDKPPGANGLPDADIIVANPPYNCHEHDYLRAHKERFALAFGRGAALNLYSLFIHAIIRSAGPGCLIGLITFDSFLTARGHEELRRFIRRECRIHSLLLCPTDLFRDQGADVRTAILVLQKGPQEAQRIEVAGRPESTGHFERILKAGAFRSCAPAEVFLSSPGDRGEFVVEVPQAVRALFAMPRLGELFPCKTGISTGNDRAHLSPAPGAGFTVPFYKNPGNRRFYTEPDAYLRDDYKTAEQNNKNFIIRNRPYIGRPGIACSSMGVAFGAAILPEGSAFGVNANLFPKEKDRWWLLAYLNSSLCNYLVRGVLLRSNMITAGYVARIPVPEMTAAARRELEQTAREAYETGPGSAQALKFIERIDELAFDACAIPEPDRGGIREFCANIVERT